MTRGRTMKNRSRLAWLGALALILAVPPVASSVVGDVGSASKDSERKQNQRLDRHTQRINKHSRQIKSLRRADYGEAFMTFPSEGGVERPEHLHLTTGRLPTDGEQAVTSGSWPLVSEGGEKVGIRGAIFSNRQIAGGGKGAAIGAIVCAPTGGSTCANGSVSAGETVCSIQGTYNSGTGVLTFKNVPRNRLGDDSPGHADIGGKTCTLPAGGGRYTATVTAWFLPELIG
jgi:hypothetical protein